jgi:hypothetical protein
MKFTVRFFIGLLLLIGCSAFAQTQDSVEPEFDEEYTDSVSFEEYQPIEYPPDTLTIHPRDFSEDKVKELRADEDFNYAEAPTVGESLWDRFWRWVGQFILELFGKMATTNWGNVLLYVLALVVLTVIVMAVLKVDAFRILAKGDGSAVTKGVFHENIHEMDFDTLIKEAVANRDYRNAVRLVFLQSLKILADKQHINWQAGKTNHDYVDEVQTLDVKKGLGQLSYYFDYAWYGGFMISETQFSRLKTIFDSWRGTIK